MPHVEITDIKITKKGMYALFCGEEFLFSIDDALMLQYDIAIGRELDELTYQKLQDDSNYSRVKRKALELLSFAPHTCKGLEDKLARHFDSFSAKKAVRQMCELGLIDDRVYAQTAIDGVITRKRMSSKEAFRYLTEKGVSIEDAQELLQDYTDGERTRLLDLLSNKYCLTDEKKENDRIFFALMRKGYAWSDIKSVVREMEENHE